MEKRFRKPLKLGFERAIRARFPHFRKYVPSKGERSVSDGDAFFRLEIDQGIDGFIALESNPKSLTNFGVAVGWSFVGKLDAFNRGNYFVEFRERGVEAIARIDSGFLALSDLLGRSYTSWTFPTPWDRLVKPNVRLTKKEERALTIEIMAQEAMLTDSEIERACAPVVTEIMNAIEEAALPFFDSLREAAQMRMQT
jgi:hypothetical protein